jgi:hypothetical protein
VIKIDPKNKRIVLSVGAYLKTRSDEEIQEFVEKHPRREVAPKEAEAAGDDDAGDDGPSDEDRPRGESKEPSGEDAGDE